MNKNQISKHLPGKRGMALGAAVLAASFFILRKCLSSHRKYEALEERISVLEYDRFYETQQE